MGPASCSGDVRGEAELPYHTSLKGASTSAAVAVILHLQPISCSKPMVVFTGSQPLQQHCSKNSSRAILPHLSHICCILLDRTAGVRRAGIAKAVGPVQKWTIISPQMVLNMEAIVLITEPFLLQVNSENRREYKCVDTNSH